MSPRSLIAPADVRVHYAEVIGDPVGHSKSPLIHNHWLSQLRVPGEYRLTEVRSAYLPEFLSQRRQDPDWRGCNVTVPHKETVIDHLDDVDARAAAVGAVNCVIVRADRLIGFNSDVDGVAAALDGVALEGRKAALIGAGGAARAALAFLAESRVAEVAFVARNTAKAERLRAVAPETRIEIGTFDQATALFAGSAVIINASPLGMANNQEMPDAVLEAASGSESATVFDMVYSPIETSFLTAARGRRVNGLTMLVGQARKAFELFYGSPAPATDQALLDLLVASG